MTTTPTTPKPCDHKFVDSTHCLKCGWAPPQCEMVDSPGHDGSDDVICKNVAVAVVNGSATCSGCTEILRKADLIETIEELS